MIETMEQSDANVLGYRCVDEITKDDYATLTPAVESAIKQYGTVRILMDLTEFKWEKVNAWGKDLGFGKQFHDKIERMAIVGHGSFGKHLTQLAQPFYAQEAEFFTDSDSAWTWVKG